MDLIGGFIHVLSPWNLLFCFIGCVLGTLVGVLPGLGPASTLSILLPITMYMDPTGSIIMMAGLYYGAQYGGSTTSILVNIPGEASSVPTCFDGFQMTKKGRAGEALWIAAVGSFIAGTIGCVVLSLVGPELAKHALKFGPPEYFGLIFFSLTAMISFSGPSILKGLSVGLLGLILATIGLDPLTGTKRFAFGSVTMLQGFEIVPISVGLFGISEILSSANENIGKIYEGKLGRMMPKLTELKKGLWASIRATFLGIPLGMLPGMVTPVVSFMAYDLEKRISKYPEKFGTGVIEGVAAPEAANNATAQSGFVPLMCLGIPTGPSMAIILAALMLYGLQPGPLLFVMKKDFVWTVIASMYVGNVMLLVLNLPLVGLWAKVSQIPFKYLAPSVLGVCVVGAYSPRNSLFDVFTALVAGVLGYVMKQHKWPLGPLVLGFILGPMMEQALRQSLSMQDGVGIFLNRPIALFFIIAAVVLFFVTIRMLNRVPKELLEENPDA